MLTEVLLKYALDIDTDKLVSIESIANGKKCNCKCPSCGQPLIAKQGDIKEWHFAHESSDCEHATQTLAHLLAKDIIKEKGFTFPCIPGVLDTTIKQFDFVDVEKRVGDIVPDLVVKIGNTEIIIEVAVTHFIDDSKRNKLLKLGIPAIQRFLSDLN